MANERLKAWQSACMYSNLIVGLVAAGFMLGTYALLELPVHVPLVVLGASGAFLVYQADRSIFVSPEDRLNQPERIAWAVNHRTYVIGSSLAAGALALGMLAFVRPNVRWMVCLYALAGCIYAVPEIGDRFRSTGVHLGKPLIIAAGWSFGGVVLPALQAGVAVESAVWLLAIYRVGFVLPNPLLADWMDRQGDLQAGVFTPAAFASPRLLQRISQLLLAVTIVGAAGAVVVWDASELLWIDLLGGVLMLAVVSGRLPRRRWFYSVTLDALIAWPAVTALVYFVR